MSPQWSTCCFGYPLLNEVWGFSISSKFQSSTASGSASQPPPSSQADALFCWDGFIIGGGRLLNEVNVFFPWFIGANVDWLCGFTSGSNFDFTFICSTGAGAGSEFFYCYCCFMEFFFSQNGFLGSSFWVSFWVTYWANIESGSAAFLFASEASDCEGTLWKCPLSWYWSYSSFMYESSLSSIL